MSVAAAQSQAATFRINSVFEQPFGQSRRFPMLEFEPLFVFWFDVFPEFEFPEVFVFVFASIYFPGHVSWHEPSEQAFFGYSQ